MLSKPIPRWVFIAGFSLAGIAGSVNAVGLLCAHHQALSHMSGPLTVLANELALGNRAALFNAFAVIASFFGGCVLSALLIQQEALKLGRRYGTVLVLESGFLFMAWWFLRQDRFAGECFAALACGLQNAMVSSYSGAVIRTTHMTGIVTDLGITLGQALRGAVVDRRRAGLYSVLLGGFFSGAIAGSYGYLSFGFSVLLAPAALTGVGGMAYILGEARFFPTDPSRRMGSRPA